MDSGSEYPESDESSSSEASRSERERRGQVEEGDGDDDDDDGEIDPRDLMTSPPPLSPSYSQQHLPSSSNASTSQIPTTSRPGGNHLASPLAQTRHSSTHSFIIPSILSTNAYAQGADARTYFTRPNRFFGAPTTWKSWTQTERDLAKAIDRARATDLSLHLCGAFVLRRELAGGARSRRGRRRSVKGKGKARASDVDGNRDESHGGDSGDEGDDDLNPAAPVPIGSSSLPRTWTAWPMPADQVPRDELLPRLDAEGVYRTGPDIRPSAALEECLIATVTRLARERWNRRDWQDDEKKDDIEGEKEGRKQLFRRGTGHSIEQAGREGAFDDEDQEEPYQDPSDPEDDEASDDNAEEQDEVQDDDPDYPMFTSQPYASPTPSLSDTGTSSRLKNELDSPRSSTPSPDPLVTSRPVPLADDTQARELFLPSARHILTKLDDLLLSLHKARAAYGGKPIGKPRGRSSSQRSRVNASTSVSVSRTREATETRGRGQSRGRLPRRDASSRNNDADGEDYDEDDDEDARPQSRAHSHRRTSSADTDLSMPSTPQPIRGQENHRKRKRPVLRTEKLPPRDWSDVVGMAALSGWDPNVVRRAGERCARLFGENMLFRTFFEGESEGNRLTGKGSGETRNQSWFTEQLALDDESSPCNSAAEDEENGAGESAVDKVRTSAPCTQCRAARYGCMPPGNEDDKSDVDEPEKRSGFGTWRVTCRRCARRGLECSGITVQESRERVCPHKRCERHEIPFRKRYHLQRHLNALHAGMTPAVARHSTSRGRNASLMRHSTSSVGAGVGASSDGDGDLKTAADSDTRMDLDLDYAATSAGEPFDFLNIDGQSRDIIVCPVLKCKRHQIPFSRGVKLYDHVRRMHPHVNIEALKKSETSRRGEHRGRPKSKSKSQTQSRSQSRLRGVPVVAVEISDDSEE